MTRATETETTNRYGDRIAVGQLWADNDPREQGRTVRVVEISAQYAYVETVTKAGGEPAAKRRPGRILIDRLHPVRSGYRLLDDPTVPESAVEDVSTRPPTGAFEDRLRAFARDCVTHGDMTPAAEWMLHRILDAESPSNSYATASTTYEERVREMRSTLDTGYYQERDYSDRRPSDDDLAWLAAWIVSEGWVKQPPRIVGRATQHQADEGREA